jgi:hypothetical protein
MGSINHELKVIFIHSPKCGGLYISTILEKFYNFKPLFSSNIFDNSTNNIKNKLQNFMVKPPCSVIANIYTDMSDDIKDVFNSYTKFTFVRNPYTKFLSAITYCSPGNAINNVKTYLDYLNKLENNNLIETKDIISNKLIETKDIIRYNKFHSIISQSEHLQINNINYDLIGRFELLDYDLIQFLLKLNLKIVHQRYLINNIVLNASMKKIDKTIDENQLKYINDLFSDDFKNFNYKMITNIDEYNTFIFNKIDIKTEQKKILDELILNKIIESPYEQILQHENTYIKILKPEYLEHKDDKKTS